MKVLIIGAGRMGIRHAQGAVTVDEVTTVRVADIAQAAVDNAAAQINHAKCETCLVSELEAGYPGPYDVCIIAATAGNRIGLLQLAANLQCKEILIEKPLGQSLEQIMALDSFVAEKQLRCSVNLNMRLYQSFIDLRNDLRQWPQMQGPKTITVNTGTLGIGANGIHYLDLLYFLLDADRAEIAAAEIDDTLIPSGRGPQFADFGGWAVINFYNQQNYLGRAMIAMAASSTVFGGWDIVAPHGRITFSEVEQVRTNTLRKADSQMPVNRYFADYLPPVTQAIESPFLGNLTANWIKGLLRGERLLPGIHESVKVHELMFSWLARSNSHQEVFPIT
jgi:predicted dehydrogenase